MKRNLIYIIFTLFLLNSVLFSQEEAKKQDKPKPSEKKVAKENKENETKKVEVKEVIKGENQEIQIRVRAKILEWRMEDSTEFGLSALYSKNLNSGSILSNAAMRLPLDSNYPDGSKSAGPGGRIFIDKLFDRYGNLGLVIEALEREGRVKVLFEPNITLSKDSPTPAKISTGSKVPYESTQIVNNSVTLVTKFKDVGITLEVKILDVLYDKYIKLEMNSNVSGLTGKNISVSLDAYENPVLVPEISTRSMKNTLLLSDKETFITGILKSHSKFDRETGVPILAKIPIIKYLFKNSLKKTTDTELAFIITPEIINIPAGVK